MDYKKYILDTLLDKYEAGKHFKGEEKVNRRVIMYFDERDFLYYDYENTEIKEEIHYIVEKLREKDILDYTWLKQQNGNIIKNAFLNLSKLDEAYSEIGRRPKKEQMHCLLYNLYSLKTICTIKWIQDFIDFSINEIQVKKKYPRFIPKKESQKYLLFSTLKGIHEKGSDEMLERIFSRKYLGNSKTFENEVRGKLTSIVKEFLFQGEQIGEKELLQEAILQEIGIIKSSEDLLFHGNMVVELAGNPIDFKTFVYGASMNTNTIKNFKVKSIGFKKLITIENKACYYSYISRCSENELVVYLGGFYSPIKRFFIEKLYDYIKNNGANVEFYHWGDIDYGGFCIFNLLKSNVIKEIQPLYMDCATLSNHIEYCNSFEAEYEEKLSSLLDNIEYSPFFDVINMMIDKNVKLEQEAYYV